MICFCKYVIDKATRRNKKVFRFTVSEGETETYKICGALFRRGNFTLGPSPYPEKFNVSTLPDLRNTGSDRGGMLHLAHLCPKHAIEFDTKLLNLMLVGSDSSGDSDRSGDDSEDSAVIPSGSSSSEASEEMLTQNTPTTPTPTLHDAADKIQELHSKLPKKSAPPCKKPPRKRPQKAAPSKPPPKKISPSRKNTKPPHKLPPPAKVAKRNKHQESDDSYSSSEDDREALAVILKKRRPNETVSKNIIYHMKSLFNQYSLYLILYLMNYFII